MSTPRNGNVLQAITLSRTNILQHQQHQHRAVQQTSNRAPQTLTTTMTMTTTTSTATKPTYVPRAIRCGRCHYYKTDTRFKQNVKVGKKWRTRHVCPVTTCESVDICGYEAGHREEMRQRIQLKRKAANELKEAQAKKKREDKAEAKKVREELKKTLKQKKEDKKRKHMFERTRKLSTYLKNIGVSET